MNRVSRWWTVWRYWVPNVADCHIQIAASLIEKERHQNGDEPCRNAWIEVVDTTMKRVVVLRLILALVDALVPICSAKQSG